MRLKFEKQRLVCMVNTLLLVLFSTFVFALKADAETASPVLNTHDMSAKAGEVINLDVDISDNPGILGMTLEVNYDSRLVLTGVANGEATQALAMTKPGSFTPGCRIHWDAYDIDEASVKNGTVATLAFKVAEGANPGDTCFVSVVPVISNGQPDVFDRNLNSVDLQGTRCSVAIEGDVPALTATASTSPVALGDTGTFSCSVEGAGSASLSYRWYFSTDGGATWRTLGWDGARTESVSATATKARAAQVYRCEVTASDGRTATTEAVGWDVLSALSATASTSPVNQNLGVNSIESDGVSSTTDSAAIDGSSEEPVQNGVTSSQSDVTQDASEEAVDDEQAVEYKE